MNWETTSWREGEQVESEMMGWKGMRQGCNHGIPFESAVMNLKLDHRDSCAVILAAFLSPLGRYKAHGNLHFTSIDILLRKYNERREEQKIEDDIIVFPLTMHRHRTKVREREWVHDEASVGKMYLCYGGFRELEIRSSKIMEQL